MKADIGVMWLQVKEGLEHQKQGEKHRVDALPETLEGVWDLNFRFLSPKL